MKKKTSAVESDKVMESNSLAGRKKAIPSANLLASGLTIKRTGKVTPYTQMVQNSKEHSLTVYSQAKVASSGL